MDFYFLTACYGWQAMLFGVDYRTHKENNHCIRTNVSARERTNFGLKIRKTVPDPVSEIPPLSLGEEV